MSSEAFANTTPVTPPTVKRPINPIAHRSAGSNFGRPPCSVAIHLKILTPVGTAIIIVAAEKYARVSTSIPTVNMWCPHTMKPKKPIVIIA